MERTHLPTCLSGSACVEQIIDQSLNHRQPHSRMQWDNDHFALSWMASGEAEEFAPLISSNYHMQMPLQTGISSINRGLLPQLQNFNTFSSRPNLFFSHRFFQSPFMNIAAYMWLSEVLFLDELSCRWHLGGIGRTA